MFQSFDEKTNIATGAKRIADLRKEMVKERLDAFLVPRADAHQGEYVAPSDQRLGWLTGFTGSAGFCAVLMGQAGVFIDGRYRLQVRNQVDLDHFTPVHWPEISLADWLKETLPNGGKVGFDPWLHTRHEIESLHKDLDKYSFEIFPVDNLVDRIWIDRPTAPLDTMQPYPIEYAGLSHQTKLKNMADELKNADHSAFVLTQPDSIAWLLNTRGTDLGQTPVTLCFAILHANATIDLFIDPRKTDKALISHLGADTQVLPVSQFSQKISALTGPVRLNKTTVPEAIVQILDDNDTKVVFGEDPVLLAKACKNETELMGTTNAHIRDGVAMAEFLAWANTIAPDGSLSEIDVVVKLEEFRAGTGALQNISFDTICGSGPNGAIMHYRVTEKSNRILKNDEVLLVDSGAQYLDGTTDITRVIAIGTPPKEAITNATLVLKGLIAISKLRFPKGLAGRDIDALARAPLWEQGLDYDHGTGHGVGVYLSVHEGPQRIAKISTQVLKPGMILSNEPGYYKPGSYGIRLENLIYVKTAPTIENSDDRDMLCFETITLAPFNTAMIDIDLLTQAEIEWLNDYHQDVWEKLNSLVSEQTKTWLEQSCKPI